MGAHRRHPSTARRAFTLVELLVAITIFLILAGMTIVMVNNTFEAERLRSGTRQVHSYLEGARDRAIYAGEPRGVRLLYTGTSGGPDPLDFAINSMVYVKPLDPDEGFLDIDVNGMGEAIRLTNISQPGLWAQYAAAGVLTASHRIRISPGTTSTITDYEDGVWYGIEAGSFQADGSLTVPDTLFITRPHLGGMASTMHAYQLELGNAVLPNSEPVLLPEGILLHLEASKVPPTWPNGAMDLMFAPNGTITGAPAAEGILHLVTCDVADCPDGSSDRVEQFFGTPTQTNFDIIEGGVRYVTVFTRTGRVSSHQADPNGTDAFEYALSGETTGE